MDLDQPRRQRSTRSPANDPRLAQTEPGRRRFEHAVTRNVQSGIDAQNAKGRVSHYRAIVHSVPPGRSSSVTPISASRVRTLSAAAKFLALRASARTSISRARSLPTNASSPRATSWGGLRNRPSVRRTRGASWRPAAGQPVYSHRGAKVPPAFRHRHACSTSAATRRARRSRRPC